MKVLVEGTAHKHIAYFTTCDTCESKLRILVGDPASSASECYNCDSRQYWIRYICPVCGELKIAKTSGVWSDKNSERKEIILNREDRQEMERWDRQATFDELSEEEQEWIENRCRI